MASDYAKIREDNIVEYGKGTHHLAFLGRLYSKKTHFLFELLQNAEDAEARRIDFTLFDDRLELTHDGREFDEKDVRGICGIVEGTKSDALTQIGKFGIGFKSVYAFTNTPEIHSGNDNFKIEGYIRPYEVASRSISPNPITIFVLPFDNPDIDAQTAHEEIGAGLKKLSARTLLFLRNIKEITYKLPDQTGGRYLREEIHPGQSRHITVIGPEGQETWLVFERPVKAPDGVQVRVEIAFGLDATAKNPDEPIVNVTDSPLVVYFPTEKETKLGFLIQGPYKTTPARDNIPAEDVWNKTLVNETALLVADTLPKLKEMGLLTVSRLEALPIKVDDFREGSMFHPIFAEVRKALLNNDLLPADDGTFVSPPNARLAGAADLRELLGGEQLQSLLQSTTPIKWLSREITKDRTPFLHAYLREQLKVEELDADKFAGKIDTRFLKNQTDEWFKAFYVYLSGHKHLWQPAGPLRDKCILRLEDGSQARPFADDGETPMVYLPPENATEFPVVKREIASDERAKNFLKSLGYPSRISVTRLYGRYFRSTMVRAQHQSPRGSIRWIFRRYLVPLWPARSG
ncbi:MAG: hypothetical protein HKL96_03910 [Phycisphaerales bacterium]|nr:hypothetical protein [Phycisphaerales bacterium]